MRVDEDAIRAKALQGDSRAAMALALAQYGPELYGFLRHVSASEEAAQDAYGILCENLWKGFGTFRWESSFRTWAYTLARHACRRVRSNVARLAKESPFEVASVLAAPPRTETRPYLRTDVKSRVAALRDKLTEDERTLLVLRVDRGLAWHDIAHIMLEAGADRGDDALVAMAATCRKRFERTKDRLRVLARQEGLLREDA